MNVYGRDLPPGITYTSTGAYSGYYTSADPDRQYVFNSDDDDFSPSVVPASQAPHLMPLTLDDAKAQARDHYQDIIRSAQDMIKHIDLLS